MGKYHKFIKLIIKYRETDKDEENKKKKKNDSFGSGSVNYWVNQFSGNYKPEKPTNLKFADVLGIEEHLEELLELVDFLKRPDDYIKAGAQLPKGLLLTGKPGVGKTMMARALVNFSVKYNIRLEKQDVVFFMLQVQNSMKFLWEWALIESKTYLKLQDSMLHLLFL